ncbi:hypothetical protein VTJ04DRAFT_5295 [Mycothermus thermophilus]|uniref:uncharacterized protein n=1 Tax=Humicola insolens TaxID=85995 RepID=UPI003743D466
MKNRKKSRSGCRTCKLRRLRCDETKPACRNCIQKELECPGYQQRLQWSTKHERPTTTQTSAPANFAQLVTAASESIVKGAQKQTQPKPAPAEDSGSDAKTTLLGLPPSRPDLLTVPYSAPTGPASPWSSASQSSVSVTSSSSSSSSSSASSAPSPATLSPAPQFEDPVAFSGSQAPLLQADGSVLPKTEPETGDEIIEVIPQAPTCQPVVNIPNFLIEHWFKSVCSSWSARDSAANPYRRLTADLWHASPAVYYSLQSISAASLVERLPHVMRDTAQMAPRYALSAIKDELIAFYSSPTTRFPTELLLALFCMSSSMCWMESRQLGQKLVRQARAVLKSLKTRQLDKASQEQLDFFNGCLVYEEMLRSVVSEEDIDFQNMLSWPESEPGKALVAQTPHPWSGVSPEVLKQFGKVMALCRRSRTRWRLNEGTSYEILQGALKDIHDATLIEESLLPPGFCQMPKCQPPPLNCDDPDLHYITEAYRLCALLQLYETFPDLCTKRVPMLKNAERSTVWHTWVSPLALHVTEILAKVPPGNLSCIQPLLCLCAGSGLRYENKVKLGSGPNSYLLGGDYDVPVSTTIMSPTPTTAATPLAATPATAIGAGLATTTTATPSPLNPTSVPLATDLFPVSEAAVRISQARQFVMDRLDQLELCLPPKPIGVAKKLMRAVWSAYDEEIGMARRTHWLDVMSLTGLSSLFG